MIKVYSQIPISEFEPWGEKAQGTLEKIILSDKADEFEKMITNLYQNGIEDIELNDLLAFNSMLIFKVLKIEE